MALIIMNRRILISRIPYQTLQNCSSNYVKDFDLKRFDGLKEISAYGGKSARPKVSGDFTIYKYQLPSLLTVTHRFTGLALSTYLAAIGVGAICLPQNFNYYLTIMESANFSLPMLLAIKFLIAFPLSFHTVNGIKHLIWDAGRCLTIKSVYATGYTSMAVSLLSTVAIVGL